MRFFFAFLLCLFFNAGKAQTANKGSVLLQLNFGQGIYNQNASYTLESGIGAAPRQLELSGHYCIMDRLSIGLKLRSNMYVINEDEDTTRVNVINASGAAALITTRIYIVDKEKFNFYGGVGIGGSFIDLEVNGPNGIRNALALMDGFSQNIDFGINWFFTKRFALNLSLGYINHNLRFDYLEVDGQEVNQISNIRKDISTLNHRGLDAQIGLTFKI